MNEEPKTEAGWRERVERAFAISSDAIRILKVQIEAKPKNDTLWRNVSKSAKSAIEVARAYRVKLDAQNQAKDPL